MSYFDKTSYLRALFVLFPMGVLGLYFGFNGLIESEKDLIVHRGSITNITFKNIFQDDLNDYFKSYVIEIDTLEEFNTHFTEDIYKLKNNVDVGDKVIIWTREKSKLRIAKLQRGDGLIISYNPTTGVDILILVIGLILTPLSVMYLIKYHGDLSGRNK